MAALQAANPEPRGTVKWGPRNSIGDGEEEVTLYPPPHFSRNQRLKAGPQKAHVSCARGNDESHVFRDRLRDDVVSGWRGHPGSHDALLKLWGDRLNENLETAAVFRQRAEELRLIARNSQDVGAQKSLWDLAKDYERKAREREEQT